MKATKENYKQLRDVIANDYNLSEVTSVIHRSGYPSGRITLLEGLDSEAQAQEILDKYEGAKLFELEWKDGWVTRYRCNSDGDVTYRCIAIGFDPFFLPSEEE